VTTTIWPAETVMALEVEPETPAATALPIGVTVTWPL
jgi:hypothetical protein